jgi:hypothetical protein
LIPDDSLYLIGAGVLSASVLFCICYLINKVLCTKGTTPKVTKPEKKETAKSIERLKTTQPSQFLDKVDKPTTLKLNTAFDKLFVDFNFLKTASEDSFYTKDILKNLMTLFSTFFENEKGITGATISIEHHLDVLKTALRQDHQSGIYPNLTRGLNASFNAKIDFLFDEFRDELDSCIPSHADTDDIRKLITDESDLVKELFKTIAKNYCDIMEATLISQLETSSPFLLTRNKPKKEVISKTYRELPSKITVAQRTFDKSLWQRLLEEKMTPLSKRLDVFDETILASTNPFQECLTDIESLFKGYLQTGLNAETDAKKVAIVYTKERLKSLGLTQNESKSDPDIENTGEFGPTVILNKAISNTIMHLPEMELMFTEEQIKKLLTKLIDTGIEIFENESMPLLTKWKADNIDSLTTDYLNFLNANHRKSAETSGLASPAGNSDKETAVVEKFRQSPLRSPAYNHGLHNKSKSAQKSGSPFSTPSRNRSKQKQNISRSGSGSSNSTPRNFSSSETKQGTPLIESPSQIQAHQLDLSLQVAGGKDDDVRSDSSLNQLDNCKSEQSSEEASSEIGNMAEYKDSETKPRLDLPPVIDHIPPSTTTLTIGNLAQHLLNAERTSGSEDGATKSNEKKNSITSISKIHKQGNGSSGGRY